MHSVCGKKTNENKYFADSFVICDGIVILVTHTHLRDMYTRGRGDKYHLSYD